MLKLEGIEFNRDRFRLTADFELDAPGLTAVIGPSGGGKSTLLSLIAGFDLPDKGRVLWQGQDLGPLSPGARPVAMLFQDNNLFPHLDIVTNTALGASPRARPSVEALDRAKTALERVGIAEHANRKPGELSGGQQSRAALARFLLTDRPVVLLDEAFAALGPALRIEMIELVTTLLPAANILMVTHDVEDARRASQVIFVDDGQVLPPEPSAALFKTPHEALKAYLV